MMERYEYMIRNVPAGAKQGFLDGVGARGWEVVWVKDYDVSSTYYLKRRVFSPRTKRMRRRLR